MNILILEDENSVINKINSKIGKLMANDYNKIIINLNYLSFVYSNKINKNGSLNKNITDIIKLSGFNYILIDRDNQYGIDFHTMFFKLLDKNVSKKIIINFKDLKKMSKTIYLISGAHKNNIDFIEQFIKFCISKKLINNFKEQKEVERVLNGNIYTKSISYRFKELLKNIN